MTSGRKNYATGFLVVILILIIVPTIIFVGPELAPDAPKRNESISGRGTNLYIAKLEAGTWTVTVSADPFWGLHIDIHITGGNVLVPFVIATAENSYTVRFDLTHPTAVHIRVIESSTYHDSHGFYSIRISGGDGANLPFPIVLPFFSIFLIIPSLFCISIIILAKIGAKGHKHTSETIQRTSTSTEHDTTTRIPSQIDFDYMAPRLPSRCPNCGASLSAMNVDWIGPLEAICLHCEAVVKAKFEHL
ncbi:MAG: hypothetical protein GF411_16550 [Candidatus Lokiarchaeota archaeon]|nr:hypothetical protein [Candidatus Lokiarchaeota archaeon]